MREAGVPDHAGQSLQDEASMILVTGGTGMVGGEILRLLSQAGVAARALVRTPQKAPKLPGITWVHADLAKPETLPAAFAGCDTVFLVSSIGLDTVALQHNAIEAARGAGVKHIVKLSAFGTTDHAKAPILIWHYQIEEEMKRSGIEWTILRPHHFMQNLLTQLEYIVNDGVVYSPSGDGKIPYVDARDIAAVAAVTLTKPGHRGKTYVVTGGEALSYRQATEIISNTIGKKLRFIEETPEAARARREREGYPPAIIEGILVIGAHQRAGGKTVTITSVVRDLTGRPPRTFAEFARDHAAAFRG
jgi:uncharacterized protein YbjT (DUF2867 family)